MNRKSDVSGLRLTDRFIDDACKTLAANKLLRRSLPVWGRVHIDRQQPFLCIYRRPTDRADAGTDKLVLGQAAYIQASGQLSLQPSLRKLVIRLAELLAHSFGAVAVLELWSSPEPPEEQPERFAALSPRFRLFAPRRDVPAATIRTLEQALLAANWKRPEPEVTIAYTNGRSPPGMPTLMTARQARKCNCTILGLEVAPHYRDPETGDVLPRVLNAMRPPLGHVLKRGFYTFSHTRATYRPAHFHELGRARMTKVVWQADASLARISASFDLVLDATPVNSDTVWRRFQRDRYQRGPEFLYRPQRVDPARLKRELYRIPVESIEDPTLYHLFAEKRDELDRQITMLGDLGGTKFLLGSRQVYGDPDHDLVAEARAILAKLPPHSRDDRRSRYVDAATFARCGERELAHYRKIMPDLPARIQLRDDIPGVMVSKGQFLIGRRVHIPVARMEATLQHEIGTHVVTYCNGSRQPFAQLREGMCGYVELQEAIAVLAEYLVGGLSRPRMRVLAGRVVAVACLTRGADFMETFGELTLNCHFSRKEAFMIAMRVHRGGGLTKDMVYLRGLAGLLRYLGKGKPLEDLLIGKIALHHMVFVNELKWRQILEPVLLRPRFLDNPAARRRLDHLKKGVQVSELMGKEGI